MITDFLVVVTGIRLIPVILRSHRPIEHRLAALEADLRPPECRLRLTHDS
jgi:hypothetical protein